MRILHVLDHSLPLHSGYAFRSAAILREQRALGWQTLQMTTPRHHAAAEIEEADGIRFHRTPRSRSPLATLPGFRYAVEMNATRRRLDTLIAAFAPDVLHAHSPVLNALPALAAGRRHAIPVVYELRALWEDAAVDHGTQSERSTRYRSSRALETFALRRADHVTTICEGLRDEITARGVSCERITVIPNAVDVASFSAAVPVDARLRRELGLEGATVLGFAGSFFAYEGLELLIDALARLVPSHPKLRLLLVGGGPQEAALKARVIQRKLEDRVVFAGRVPHDKVASYYALIDLLAYPRRRMRLTELVTPLKPLEAMAQGKIFVASNVGGHRELITHGETGYLFPADDVAELASAIERALAARADWPRIAARARHFVESERTWKASVARYAPVYASLTAARGHRIAATAG